MRPCTRPIITILDIIMTCYRWFHMGYSPFRVLQYRTPAVDCHSAGVCVCARFLFHAILHCFTQYKTWSQSVRDTP